MNKTEFLHQFHHAYQVRTESDYPLKSAGKPAAVLLPIVERREKLTMLFTQRAKHLKHHAGQVSFPGGKQEAFDQTLLETALRETEEEIGLSREFVQVIGNLPRYRTVSRYEVVPYISFVQPEFTLSLDQNEVAETFEVPLDFLLDQANHLIHWVERSGQKHPIYFIPWEDKTIWGATAAFVRNLSNHILRKAN